MTRRSSSCCSCFSCFSGRNTPSPSGLPDASAAAVDPNAPSPTEMVATGYHPSSSTSGAQGKSNEPSFSSSSAHQDASCAVVVKQDEVVPSPPSGGASSIPLAAPPCAASSSSNVPETATSSASSRVPTVAMATDDIHHSQQSVASSSTQPGEAQSSSLQGMPSSSSTVPETATSSASSRVPTVAMATDDIHHSQQSVASSSTQPGEAQSSSLQGMPSSSSTVPETATSSASSRVPTVAMATDDIHHSQQSVASSSTQPGEASSSSSTVPETATSSASSRVPTVAMATDDIHHSQQSVASSSTQPGEASSSSIGDNVDVDLDALIERISERLRLIKEREKPPQTKGAQQYWPTTSKTFIKLKELISEGITVVKDVIPGDVIKTAVKGLLQGMGTAHLVTAGLLVVANILERFEEVKANKDECLRLLKEMIFLGKVVKQFKERPQLNDDEGMHSIIKEATGLIIEGCTKCCCQIDSSKYSK
eukprot:PITA_11027